MNTFVLGNLHGMKAVVTNYGGRIMRLLVPDRDGRMQEKFPEVAASLSLATTNWSGCARLFKSL